MSAEILPRTPAAPGPLALASQDVCGAGSLAMGMAPLSEGRRVGRGSIVSTGTRWQNAPRSHCRTRPCAVPATLPSSSACSSSLRRPQPRECGVHRVHRARPGRELLPPGPGARALRRRAFRLLRKRRRSCGRGLRSGSRVGAGGQPREVKRAIARGRPGHWCDAGPVARVLDARLLRRAEVVDRPARPVGARRRRVTT